MARARVGVQIYLAEVTAADSPSSLHDGSGSSGAGEVTVLARLLAAGISEDRARAWITGGGTRVDGHTVTEPTYPAEPPARVTMHPA